MTESELDAIEARAKNAMYYSYALKGDTCSAGWGSADMDIQALCAEVRAAWAERDRILALLREERAWSYFVDADMPRTRPGLKTLEDAPDDTR